MINKFYYHQTCFFKRSSFYFENYKNIEKEIFRTQFINSFPSAEFNIYCTKINVNNYINVQKSSYFKLKPLDLKKNSY